MGYNKISFKGGEVCRNVYIKKGEGRSQINKLYTLRI
jgi:hypothetical protein